jgi:predicted nucleic acid-binding protein
LTITIDASAAAAWLLPDEASPAADHLYSLAVEHQESFQAPALWAWEAGNLLHMAARRGRLTTVQVRRAIEALSKAGVRLEHAPDSSRMVDILAFSSRRSLTFYDASYLEQAIRTGARLASKDAALRRAAIAEGVVCLEL